MELIASLGVFGVILAITIALSPLLSYLELRKIRKHLEQNNFNLYSGFSGKNRHNEDKYD